jgi:hypothetical protein
MPQKYPRVKANVFVLHAGTRSEDLIDGCDLVFVAKSKDDDYHQEMNSVVFLESHVSSMYTISYPASLKDLIFLR